MSIRPEGWQRSEQTSVVWILCWAMLFCSYALCLLWLMSRISPRLNDTAKEKGITRDEFNKLAAQCIVAITTHVFLGPLAFYNLFTYQFNVPLHATLSGYTFPPAASESWVINDERACRIGEVFTGNMIYQTLFWFLGWEKSWEMLAHHIGFFVAGYLTIAAAVYPKLCMSAISMELSSPFLSLYLLTRMLDGEHWELVSNLSMVVFSFLFVVIRLGIYSFVVLEFHYLYWWHSELFPPSTPTSFTKAILIIFTLGWVLQLMWGRLVVSKSLKFIIG